MNTVNSTDICRLNKQKTESQLLKNTLVGFNPVKNKSLTIFYDQWSTTKWRVNFDAADKDPECHFIGETSITSSFILASTVTL